MIKFLNKGGNANYDNTLTPKEYVEAVTKTENILNNAIIDSGVSVLANEQYYGDSPSNIFTYIANKSGTLHINASGWLNALSIKTSNGYTGNITKFKDYGKICNMNVEINEGDTVTLETTGGYNSFYSFVIFID